MTVIRYCPDAYRVTTAAGQTFTFWEHNLRFKTDSGPEGPVLAGMSWEHAAFTASRGRFRKEKHT